MNENGIQELTLMFQADATGKAIIPEGMDLEPMTLYALFEDPKDIPAETAPETEGVE